MRKRTLEYGVNRVSFLMWKRQYVHAACRRAHGHQAEAALMTAPVLC